jgi:hypothetical protein
MSTREPIQTWSSMTTGAEDGNASQVVLIIVEDEPNAHEFVGRK